MKKVLKVKLGTEWVDLDPRNHGRRIVRAVGLEVDGRVIVEVVLDAEGRAPKGRPRRTLIAPERFHPDCTKRSGYGPRL